MINNPGEACLILGVELTGLTKAIVMKTFRKKVHEVHPDHLPPDASEEEKYASNKAFERVIYAKDCLIDYLNKQKEREQSPKEKVHKEKEINLAPKLKIIPLHIRFKDLDPLRTKTAYIEINNIGGLYTDFKLSTSGLPQWLQIINIRHMSNEELPLLIRFKVIGQELGTEYHHHIPVTIENKQTGARDELKIHIEMCMKQPTLQIVENIVEFNLVPGMLMLPRIVTLGNLGKHYIEGSLYPNEKWIKVSPQAILFSGKQEIQIQIDPSLLKHDTSGVIDIKTNSGNGTILVKAKMQVSRSNKDIEPFSTLYYCPVCKRNTVWFNRHQNIYECLRDKKHRIPRNDIKTL